MTNCPNWNARELETALIPAVMSCVSPEILKGNVKKDALEALEQERAALQQEKKALNNLLDTVERFGASDTLANRIREFEGALARRRVRVAELSAIVNEPVTAIWEEDLEEAIVAALQAVHDITNELMRERAELHQSFTRVVSKLWVWPGSHAALQLRHDEAKIFIPLSEQAPIQAALAGGIAVPIRVEPVAMADAV